MLRGRARTSHASSAACPAVRPAPQVLVGPRPATRRHACAQCSVLRAHENLLTSARTRLMADFRTTIWGTEATLMSLTSPSGRNSGRQDFLRHRLSPPLSPPSAKLPNGCLERHFFGVLTQEKKKEKGREKEGKRKEKCARSARSAPAPQAR